MMKKATKKEQKPEEVQEDRARMPYFDYVEKGDELVRRIARETEGVALEWCSAPKLVIAANGQPHVRRGGKYVLRCQDHALATMTRARLQYLNTVDPGLHVKIKLLRPLSDLRLSITDGAAVYSRSADIVRQLDKQIDWYHAHEIQAGSQEVPDKAWIRQLEQMSREVARLREEVSSAPDATYRLRAFHGHAYRLSYYDLGKEKRRQVSLGDIAIYVGETKLFRMAEDRKPRKVRFRGWKRIVDRDALGPWELLRWRPQSRAKKDLRIK